MQKDVAAEDKVSELSEEDVAVSYIGDELDLKTVGDIIAIIEDKVKKKVLYIFAGLEINCGQIKVSITPA